jgi:hypothetical protein
MLRDSEASAACAAAGLLIGLAIAILVIGCVCGRYRRQHRGVIRV